MNGDRGRGRERYQNDSKMNIGLAHGLRAEKMLQEAKRYERKLGEDLFRWIAGLCERSFADKWFVKDVLLKLEASLNLAQRG